MPISRIVEKLSRINAAVSVEDGVLTVLIELPLEGEQLVELHKRGFSETATTYHGVGAALGLADVVQATWPELIDEDVLNGEAEPESESEVFMDAFADAASLAAELQALHESDGQPEIVGVTLTDPDGAPNVYCEVLIDPTHGPMLVVRAVPGLSFDVALTPGSARRLADLLHEASSRLEEPRRLGDVS
jgi:hypothetical protein